MKVLSLNDQVDISDDKSLKYLQQLRQEGYDTVTFSTHPGACPKCSYLDGSEWTIDSFINEDTVSLLDKFQNAPFFSHFHPGATGKLIVSGVVPDGTLKNVVMTYKMILNPGDIGKIDSKRVHRHFNDTELDSGNFSHRFNSDHVLDEY